MKKKKQQSLKALQKVWYQKLKDNGFEDIEDPKNGLLKSWHSHYFKSLTPQYTQSNTEYYRIAGQLNHTHKFKGVVEQSIWSKHSEGKTVRQIAKELHISTKRVQALIQEVRSVNGIKNRSNTPTDDA